MHMSSARPTVAGLRIFLALTLTTAALAGCGGGARGDMARVQPEPASRPPGRILAHLSSAAQGARVRDALRLTHFDSGGLWTLSAVAGRKWFCLALNIPHTLIDSSCAVRAQIKSEQVLAYPRATPGRHGVGTSAYVVYGVVSPTVRSLTLRLSDCTTVPVSLEARPLFWAFVSPVKLADHIVPTRFAAATNSRAIREPLEPLGGSPRGRCAAGG